MKPLTALEKLPPEVKRKIRPFVEALLALHGQNILSIFIYGSATGTNYIPKKSDINSGIVFHEIPFRTLNHSLKIVRQGMRQGISPPLFLTKEYIASSLDVFPIEFLEMKENHVLIYGEDFLSSLSIPEGYIRLFCEQQLKGTLIRTRQFYLQGGHQRAGIKHLLRSSLNSLIPIFRNLLRLQKKLPSDQKTALLRQLAEEFGLTPDAFGNVYTNAISSRRASPEEWEHLLERYLQEIGQLIKKVNGR